MDWQSSTLWWMLAGILVAAELLTGTFYLLMLALGAVAAALTAHLGMPLTAQLTGAALVGGGAIVGWHFKRSLQPSPPPTESNRDLNLDIGQSVHVDAWSVEGSARVQYRGSSWTVNFAGPGAAEPGLHTIVAVIGSQLRVQRSAPH